MVSGVGWGGQDEVELSKEGHKYLYHYPYLLLLNFIGIISSFKVISKTMVLHAIHKATFTAVKFLYSHLSS